MLERRPVAATAWSNVVCSRPSLPERRQGVEVRVLQLRQLPVFQHLGGQRVLLGQLLEHFLSVDGPVFPRFRTGRLSFL